MKKSKKFLWKIKIKKNQWPIIFVVLITLLAALFYLFKLEFLPSGFHGDEAELSLFSLKILEGKVKTLIGVGQHNHPILSFLPQVVTMGFFGINIFGARLASALIGIIIVPFFWFFIKEIWGPKTAFLATILLATSHWIIAINRLAINNNQTMILGILSFFMILKAFKSDQKFFYFLAGGLSAFNLYLYAGAKIFPLIVFFVLVLEGFNKRKRILNYSKNVLVFGIAFFLIALPQANFFLHNQRAITSRAKSIYIFGSGSQWWGQRHYQNQNNWEILWQQTKKTFDLSSRGGDSCGQYGYRGRIFNPFFLASLFVGIALCLISLKKSKSFLLLLWLFLPLFFGQILMIDPFAFPRAVPALPSVFILTGMGINFFWEKINFFSPKKLKPIFIFGLGFLILLTVFQSLYIFFIESEKKTFGDPNKYAATKIAKYLKANHQDEPVVFLTAPLLYADFAPIRFIAPKIKTINIKKPLEYQAKKLDQKTLFVAYPHHLSKLKEVIRLNPDGRLITEHNQKGEIQYYLYEIRN